MSEEPVEIIYDDPEEEPTYEEVEDTEVQQDEIDDDQRFNDGETEEYLDLTSGLGTLIQDASPPWVNDDVEYPDDEVFGEAEEYEAPDIEEPDLVIEEVAEPTELELLKDQVLDLTSALGRLNVTVGDSYEVADSTTASLAETINTGLETADVASSALDEATAAQAKADLAEAAALLAQSQADIAAGQSSTASKRITISEVNPSATEGYPEGAIWEVRSDQTAQRRYVLLGSTWTPITIGQNFIGANSIGSAQIIDASIGTAQIADLAVTNGKIGSLNVGKLVAAGPADWESVQAALADNYNFINKLAVDMGRFKLLTADRVVIGPGGNMLPYNLPTSEWPLVTYQNSTYNPRVAEIDPSTSLPHPDRVTLYVDQTKTGLVVRLRMMFSPNSEMIPIQGGNQYRGSWRVRRINGINTTARCHVYWYDKDNTYLSTSWGDTYDLTNNDYVEVFTTADAPLNAASATLNLAVRDGAPSVFVAQPDFRPAVTGSLVVNGSISANAIEASSFTGYIFTGSIFRTAASGARVQIDTNGIRAWNASNVLTADIQGSSGSLNGFDINGGTVTGSLVRTSSGGTRAAMMADSNPGFAFYKNNQTVFHLRENLGNPELRFNNTGSTNIAVRLDSSGLKLFNTSGALRANLFSDNTDLFLEGPGGIVGGAALSLGGSGRAYLRSGASGQVTLEGAARVLLTTGNTTANMSWQIYPSGSASILRFDGGRTKMPQTTQAANQHVDADGRFYATTSRSYYKLDQRPAIYEELGLKLEPKSWIDRSAWEEDNTYGERTVGLILEEVLELGGGAHFATFNKDGVPDGLAYDRIHLTYIPILRRHEQEIAELKRQIASLTQV